MAIYIDDGVNVDASWINSIAVSADGVNWDTINKAGLNVINRWVNLPSDSPILRKSSHGLISLTVGSDDTQLITFDPNDVVNQAGWQGNTPAELQQAVLDITGWI
jgi:hypothetical protein